VVAAEVVASAEVFFSVDSVVAVEHADRVSAVAAAMAAAVIIERFRCMR
jgi:hypothetical protein